MIPRPIIRKFKSGRPDSYLEPDKPSSETEVTKLFNGIDVSQPAYLLEDNQATFISNGYNKLGIFQKCPGLVKFGTTQPLDAKVWGLVNYKLAAGTIKFIAITGNSVYYLGASDVWTYVTSGQDCFAGSDDERVEFQVSYSETIGDYILICTNYHDNIKKYDNTSITDLITAWKAKYTRNYEFFQFYGYILEGGIDYPQKIYWSDIGKPETIIGGLSGGIVLAKTSDFLTGMAILSGLLFVGKEKSCSLISYTGSYTYPFNLAENIFDVGVACGATMANLGDELLFLGSDKKVYLTDGTNKKDVSVKIKGLMNDRLNWSKINRAFASISLDEKWYFLSVPTTGNDEPSETWVLDIEDWVWQPFQCWNKIISRDVYKDTGTKVGELTSKLGLSTWKIGDLTAFEQRTCIGDSDGYVYEYNKTYLNNDGSAIDSYVDTKDFIWNPKLMKRITELILELSGYGNLTVWYSIDGGNNWSLIKIISMPTGFSEHYSYPDINCQKIRFRFRCNEVNSYFMLRRFVIDKIEKGNVKDVA